MKSIVKIKQEIQDNFNPVDCFSLCEQFQLSEFNYLKNWEEIENNPLITIPKIVEISKLFLEFYKNVNNVLVPILRNDLDYTEEMEIMDEFIESTFAFKEMDKFIISLIILNNKNNVEIKLE